MKKKRKYLFNPRLLLCTSILSLTIAVSAQTVKDTRTWTESYKVTDETTLEVENKYGTILIVPWNKDSVQVTADIFLEAKNTAKLRKLKNDLRITSSDTRTYILVRTLIGEGNSRVASELRTLSNTLSNQSTVEINYTVYLPEYINLILNNKFGDIYIDDINGDVDISLSNGVLKANSFSGNSNLELVFAKGTIHHLGTSTLNMSYAELNLGSVEQLDLASKSSELDIKTAGIVKMDSRRDKLILGEVEYLFGNSSFTDITVKNFIREADCEMKFGTLNIDNIQADYSRIDINSDYTDITLYFPRECNYFVDILHHENAVVNLPETNAKLTTRKTGEEFLTTEGVIGEGDSEKRLIIKAEHKCYINILTR
ncbi:hypothetical protein ACFLRQ_00570 [Bacteroidota bacterium]